MNQLMILVFTFTVVNITFALRCKPCKETDCIPKIDCPGKFHSFSSFRTFVSKCANNTSVFLKNKMLI